MIWTARISSRRLPFLLTGLPAVLLTVGCDSSPVSVDNTRALAGGPESMTSAGSSAVGTYAGPMAQEEGEVVVCARSPGFYCQNQDGKNPNMTSDDFKDWAEDAAVRLMDDGVDGPLDTPEKIAAAVCDTSDQLLRQLATLALNLAAGKLTDGTNLSGEDYADVGEVFTVAKNVANGVDEDVTRQERKAIKDVLDRINNNENIATDGLCEADGEDEDEGEEGEGGQGPPEGGQTPTKKITICHKKKHTITISESAWPAHEGHGDTKGPCS